MEMFFPVLITLSSMVSGAAMLIILHRSIPSSIFTYMSDPVSCKNHQSIRSHNSKSPYTELKLVLHVLVLVQVIIYPISKGCLLLIQYSMLGTQCSCTR